MTPAAARPAPSASRKRLRVGTREARSGRRGARDRRRGPPASPASSGSESKRRASERGSPSRVSDSGRWMHAAVPVPYSGRRRDESRGASPGVAAVKATLRPRPSCVRRWARMASRARRGMSAGKPCGKAAPGPSPGPANNRRVSRRPGGESGKGERPATPSPPPAERAAPARPGAADLHFAPPPAVVLAAIIEQPAAGVTLAFPDPVKIAFGEQATASSAIGPSAASTGRSRTLHEPAA